MNSIPMGNFKFTKLASFPISWPLELTNLGEVSVQLLETSEKTSQMETKLQLLLHLSDQSLDDARERAEYMFHAASGLAVLLTGFSLSLFPGIQSIDLSQSRHSLTLPGTCGHLEFAKAYCGPINGSLSALPDHQVSDISNILSWIASAALQTRMADAFISKHVAFERFIYLAENDSRLIEAKVKNFDKYCECCKRRHLPNTSIAARSKQIFSSMSSQGFQIVEPDAVDGILLFRQLLAHRGYREAAFASFSNVIQIGKIYGYLSQLVNASLLWFLGIENNIYLLPDFDESITTELRAMQEGKRKS